MTTLIHIANAKGRNATIGYSTVKVTASPKLGVLGEKILFRRYLAATETCTHEALQIRFGDEYAQALIDGDPELDIEHVGTTIEHTQVVYQDGNGELMFIEPLFIEVITDPSGQEKERRAPSNTEANINGEIPLRWSGRKIDIAEAVKKFTFKRTIQLQHIDGLTYDFLFGIAKELEESRSMMLIGAGDKGIAPVIFQANGKPYRAFLYGQTNATAYRLTLHLSELELKKPFVAQKTKD
jgi:hypothetical protein